jgi:hypothetical protein
MTFHAFYTILNNKAHQAHCHGSHCSKERVAQEAPEENVMLSQPYRICHNCWASMTPDQAFCPRCGAPYVAPIVQQPAVPPPPQVQAPYPPQGQGYASPSTPSPYPPASYGQQVSVTPGTEQLDSSLGKTSNSAIHDTVYSSPPERPQGYAPTIHERACQATGQSVVGVKLASPCGPCGRLRSFERM